MPCGTMPRKMQTSFAILLWEKVWSWSWHTWAYLVLRKPGFNLESAHDPMVFPIVHLVKVLVAHLSAQSGSRSRSSWPGRRTGLPGRKSFYFCDHCLRRRCGFLRDSCFWAGLRQCSNPELEDSDSHAGDLATDSFRRSAAGLCAAPSKFEEKGIAGLWCAGNGVYATVSRKVDLWEQAWKRATNRQRRHSVPGRPRQ